MPLPDGVRGVLLDIEGTTTPLAFVTEVLFPYARERIAGALTRADPTPERAEAVSQLRAEWEMERATDTSVPADFGDGSRYALWLMDRDRKSTGLKTLQGLLWQEGYASGALRGEIFDDVPEALARWRAAGAELGIFSSGSVLAQKLLFGHTKYGDLTPHFAHWFDTTTGAKREASSYASIARRFGLPPDTLLFLSDVVAELDAAHAAGLRTGLLSRPGNAPTEAGEHPSYGDFTPLL